MNSRINKFLLAFLLSIFLSPALVAQLSNAKVKKIDALFESWNTPDHPEGSVGVMKDGKLVYSKAFGLASLEYLVPNTYGT